MTQARSTLVSLNDTPWYHCVCRCVRRAFLCGEDVFSGKNFDHRRGWIAERVQQLAAVFAIDIAAYAVMSNHYHVVVRIDRERGVSWSDEEVLKRWGCLFTLPYLVSKYRSDKRNEMSEAELAVVKELLETYRSRLYDLSWFMRTLNETIARRANAEDGVKGRFWEGRFKSQALLDDKALVAAMAYVDLNPIRAGIAQTPESSDYTSIQERLVNIRASVKDEAIGKVSGSQENSEPALVDNEPLQEESQVRGLPRAQLIPFEATGRTPWAIPFAFEDYLELVDWTGRAVHPQKRGHISAHIPKLLIRFGMDAERFIAHAGRLLKAFGPVVGTPEAMVDLCARRQAKYLRGINTARAIFPVRQAA